jgi:hypothetical protein
MKIYDSNEVVFSFAGRRLDSGFADGEFVRIEFDSAAFEDIVGTDGEVTRSKTNNGMATVTVRLMQTSGGNQILAALHEVDRQSRNGAGVASFLLQDLNGTSIYTSPEGWISKEPDVSMDRGATPREWTLRVNFGRPKGLSFAGSN